MSKSRRERTGRAFPRDRKQEDVRPGLLRWIKGYILGEGSRSGTAVGTEVGNVVFSYPKAYLETPGGGGGLYPLGPNEDRVKMRKLRAMSRALFIYLA